MNSSAEGKYPDKFIKGETLLYEGHDVPQSKSCPDPKKRDQQLRNKDGTLTRNGLFYESAQRYKGGQDEAEIIQVYEKKTKGNWLDRGLYKLTDAREEEAGGRIVFKFKLEPSLVGATVSETLLSEDDVVNAIKSGNTEVVKEVLTSESRGTSSRRNGQAALRKLTLGRYSDQCALCDISEMLVASHIIPWSEDEAYRGMLANVICLCAMHDRLFEKGRITISDDYRVRFSDGFLASCKKSKAYSAFRDITNKVLRLPSSEVPTQLLLQKHRTRFGVK
jgi:hypothetical protein